MYPNFFLLSRSIVKSFGVQNANKGCPSRRAGTLRIFMSPIFPISPNHISHGTSEQKLNSN